jgi:long-subunit fatty acid transport protein
MKSTHSISAAHLFLGFTLSFLLVPGLLNAQYAEDVLRLSTFNMGIGARSAGMGNTSVGLADDFSALFTNPAGLASLRSFEFSAGLSNVGYNNDATFFGTMYNASSRVTNLNNLGLVYPVPTTRGSLSFAFGFARVANYSTTASFKGFNPSSSIVEALTPGIDFRGLSADDIKSLLDNNIPYKLGLAGKDSLGLFPLVTDSVQQESSVMEGGGLNSWSFGGAIEMAKGFTLGVGINILSGSYTYDRVFTETDARNVYRAWPYDFNRFRYESSVTSDISGYNVLIGMMYRKQGRYKIGFTVKTPTYYDISENFSDAGESWFKNGDYVQKKNPGSTKYTIKTPPVLSAGASVQASDWLLLAGDAEYVDWTQMEFTNDNPDLMDENRVIRDAFRATTNLRGGAEFSLLNQGIRLRGGVVYNPSPYKGDPSSRDQIYYTAGIGATVDENVFVNASLAFGKWNTLRDNYYLSGMDTPSRTAEAVNTSTLNITLTYRF